MRRLFTVAAVVAFALPAAASAQSGQLEPASLALAPAPAAVATTPVATPAPDAMVRADVAGIQRHDAAAQPHAVDAVAASTGLHQGQGVALMVVGGAAVLGGLIVGNGAGDAIAVGGLVVGLYGLYQYVR